MRKLWTRRLAAMLLALVLLPVWALSEGLTSEQIVEELDALQARVLELHTKAGLLDEAEEPDKPDSEEDDWEHESLFTPDRVHALGVLTAEEETQFFAQLEQLYALGPQYDAVFAKWDALQGADSTEVEAEMELLDQQSDALWAALSPAMTRVVEAHNRKHYAEIGLSAEDIEAYLRFNRDMQALQDQAEAVYVGWNDADDATRAVMSEKAQAFNEQMEQLQDAYEALLGRVQEVEATAYYASLTKLTPEEQQELRRLNDREGALYDMLFAMEEQGD